MPWWANVGRLFDSAADAVREFLGIGSQVEPIPGFETDPFSGEEQTTDSVPTSEPVGAEQDYAPEFDTYISSGSIDTDWESDPEDPGWPTDDEMKYSADVDKADVRGYFGSREEAENYAADIPVDTEIWYDPDTGAWWVEVDYEEP